jgi:multimeric flavodoxin WrbA
MNEFIILMPGKVSLKFRKVIADAAKDYRNQIYVHEQDIPSLQDKKILWAVELNEYGINIGLDRMLQAISERGPKALINAEGAIIIQSPVELWTKYIAYRIIFQTNQLGCRYIGHSVIEATANLVNFLTWQKNLKLPLEKIYQKLSCDLIFRLMQDRKNIISQPEILVLYSNPKKNSNTMMLWQMVKKSLPLNSRKMVKEQYIENGTIVDCRGCLYKTCKHYSEMSSCFYGGIVVQEILPAIEQADYLIWLCPNYNDAISAKMMAVINRLTVLYKKANFRQKIIFAIIVSGNSGSENVAIQLIGALNVNKGFQLPPYFSLTAIANDPGAVEKVPDIRERAVFFAQNIYQEVDLQTK